MTWPFEGLRPFGYNIILADPPWSFQNWSEAGEDRNANQHYDTLSWEAIAALPVGHLAGGDCALFLWCVDPLLDKGFDVLRAWGFRYATVAFTWAKRTRRDTDWHMGTGYYTRANPEVCLLGITGTIERQSAAVRQLIVEPVRQHSRKPDRVHDDIVKLFGDVPRCELFARRSRPGWDNWGDQVTKFDGDAAGDPGAEDLAHFRTKGRNPHDREGPDPRRRSSGIAARGTPPLDATSDDRADCEGRRPGALGRWLGSAGAEDGDLFGDRGGAGAERNSEVACGAGATGLNVLPRQIEAERASAQGGEG